MRQCFLKLRSTSAVLLGALAGKRAQMMTVERRWLWRPTHTVHLLCWSETPDLGELRKPK